MTNFINNEAAIILKEKLKLHRWTMNKFVDHLNLRGYLVDRHCINNFCRKISIEKTNQKRRNKGFPKDITLIKCIVDVFVRDIPANLAWKIDDAIRFATAVGLSPEEMMVLEDIFEDKEAFREFIWTLSEK